MRFRFEMDGEAYSKNKESFKRILAKHGLRWKGSLERPFWASGSERVTAVFDRDREKDVLRNAILLWESVKKSTLLEERTSRRIGRPLRRRSRTTLNGRSGTGTLSGNRTWTSCGRRGGPRRGLKRT